MAEERFRRKLAAILAADVAGYSRLTETDEKTLSTASGAFVPKPSNLSSLSIAAAS